VDEQKGDGQESRISHPNGLVDDGLFCSYMELCLPWSRIIELATRERETE
jgi:hypothetical protein